MGGLPFFPKEEKRKTMFVYLDNSATTRQSDEVTECMLQAMREDFGKPSSLHRLGVTAEKAVKQARKATAQSLGVSDSSVYFTSGGTEGNNTALFGGASARKRRGKTVITSAVEHPAILEPCRRLEQMGFHVEYLGVDKDGRVSAEDLKSAMTDDVILVSVMWVNNELGTIQPVEELARIAKNYEDVIFHTDAVQAWGKLPLQVTAEMDMVTVSGHKIHGPKGSGALYVKPGLHIPPFLLGGGQEKGFRSGTENVPAVLGLGKAAEQLVSDGEERIRQMGQVKARLLDGLQSEIPDIRVNSPETGCAPSVLNISFLGCRGEVLLHTLEQKGIYVSTGSACSSNTKKKGSHVLRAAGLTPEEVEGAVRFSFSSENTPEQMDYVVREVKQAVCSMRKLMKYR